MKITDVRIRKLPDEGKMKAIVSVTFDEEIVIHDIKIIEGAESLFIAMPSRKLPNGEFRDIAHPINSDARKKVEDAVFAKYEEIINEPETQETEPVQG
ncbi:septation regulator SpoVG [Anaerosphaera multitolerans]|uniref:Putative septation protein SpoVG n=1 Tax=Anaerosphaera multitolerans TaxID=2487351 RepID=A0A437S8F3_9FIRM|nr:septation regulator SpoVG [Anaerosphaera multitolerans]RVU55184.1 septation regulator SpoVG [Anaerosphaera multitolerans]